MALSRPLSSLQESAGRRSTDSNRVGVPEANVTGSKIETGVSSWSESIRDNLLLVDKSFILPRIILDKTPILLTRPRRFGKTMCLTMFDDFFGVPRGETLEKKKARYKDMKIGADPEFIDAHCGQYPVIRLDLKDVRAPDEARFHKRLFDVLDRLVERFPEIDEDVRKKVEKEEADKKAKKEAKKEVGKKDDEEVDEKTEAANRIRLLTKRKERLNERRTLMKTDITDCTMLLMSLVEFLNAYHRKACILLIDEFDTPIVNADEDNRDAIKNHIRDMLAPIVKTTEDLLKRCIMVSVNPISLAEMASGLNNFTALSLHSASMKSYPTDILKCEDLPYQITFGFTEDEVRKLIATRVFPDNEAMVDIALNVARSWYDGYYVFKNYRIYNPWSVMNFIESLVNSKTCSNEAEVLAKAQPYWIDTGGTELLTDMYKVINNINPNISGVLLRMCLDYLKLNNEDIILEGEDSNPEDEDSNPEDEDSNPEDEDSDSEDEDSIEPSASPLTSILVEMTNALPAGPSPQDNKPYFSNNTIKFIKVDIARYNQGSLTEHPTLNKFMTMAYYYGYLTMIEGMYVAIPNREVLKFWAKLLADGTGTPGEPLLLQESKVLANTLTSWDLEGFCEALKVHFLEPLIKADAGAREYYYHEIMFLQLNLGLDPDQYYCVAEFSTARGRTDICILPRVKGRMGFLIEVKRTSKDGVMDSGRSSGSTGADPQLMTDASAAATAATTTSSQEGVQEPPQPAASSLCTRQRRQGPQQASPFPLAGSGGTTNSTVDITKAPYCHLDECLKVGIRQVEEKGYLRAFAAYCTRVLTIVPAFCGKQYLVCFKNYRYAKSKLGWVPCAKHPSVKHECSRPLPDAMALVKRSTEGSSNKRAKGRGKRGGGS